jgi:hypothetical protein
VEVLRDRYEIPDDFHPRNHPVKCLGIWYTEGDPVEVVLKFTPRVASRVGETLWHRSEQLTRMDDGSLLWRAWISEPRK